MLQRGSAAAAAGLWDLLARAPPPRHATLLREDHVRHLRQAPRRRRCKAQDVLAGFQGPAWPVAPGAAAAAQAPCGFVLPCRRVVAEPRRACAQPGSPFLSTLAEDNAAADPAAVAMGQSRPGVGRQLTAWLFAEAAPSLAARDSPVWRTPGGRAPVPRHSGKRRQVGRRRGGTRRWRHARSHMARVARPREAHGASVSEARRAKGQRPGHALRNLADRRRRILLARLRDRTRYDASRIPSGQKGLTER
jgi:hypothetical protein